MRQDPALPSRNMESCQMSKVKHLSHPTATLRSGKAWSEDQDSLGSLQTRVASTRRTIFQQYSHSHTMVYKTQIPHPIAILLLSHTMVAIFNAHTLRIQ
jgi:hypothetical protein